jgi:hypothetical protein
MSGHIRDIPQVVGKPAGYVNDATGTQHVVYRGDADYNVISQAASELPDMIDTGNAQHAGMLSKYGIDPASITDKLAARSTTLRRRYPAASAGYRRCPARSTRMRRSR